MEEEKEGETFLTKVVSGGRVTVPFAVRERLGLKQGDLVRIMVLKSGKEET